MSAFFVGADHINAMLTAAAALSRTDYLPMPDGHRGPVTDQNLTEIGKALAAENIASLRSRYPSDWQEMVDLDVNKFAYDEDGRFAIRPDLWAAAVTLCQCYEYQSSEHDGWQASFAYRFSTWLVRAAASKMAGDVKGCWEYQRDRSLPPVISLSRLAATR